LRQVSISALIRSPFKWSVVVFCLAFLATVGQLSAESKGQLYFSHFIGFTSNSPIELGESIGWNISEPNHDFQFLYRINGPSVDVQAYLSNLEIGLGYSHLDSLWGPILVGFSLSGGYSLSWRSLGIQDAKRIGWLGAGEVEPNTYYLRVGGEIFNARMAFEVNFGSTGLTAVGVSMGAIWH